MAQVSSDPASNARQFSLTDSAAGDSATFSEKAFWPTNENQKRWKQDEVKLWSVVCGVCLQERLPEQQVTRLECDHAHHTLCLRKWVSICKSKAADIVCPTMGCRRTMHSAVGQILRSSVGASRGVSASVMEALQYREGGENELCIYWVEQGRMLFVPVFPEMRVQHVKGMLFDHVLTTLRRESDPHDVSSAATSARIGIGSRPAGSGDNDYKQPDFSSPPIPRYFHNKLQKILEEERLSQRLQQLHSEAASQARQLLAAETAILQEIEAERAQRLGSLHSLNLSSPDHNAQITQINDMCDRLVREKVCIVLIPAQALLWNIRSMS